MRLGLAAAVVALAGLTGGCWSTSFHASDPSFQPSAVFSDPLVYLTRLPPQPFRAVGIIEVSGPDDSTVDQAAPRAVDKGREVGCQLLVWRRLVRDTALGDRPLAVLAQIPLGTTPYPMPPGGTIGGRERPGKHQFVCGVWTSTQAPGT